MMNTYNYGESKVGLAVGDERFRKNLWEMGYKIIEMEGDGSCFFHALVQGLKQLKLSVEKLRKMVHDEVQGNRDKYTGKFEGQCGRSSEEEMDWILDSSHWADDADISILAIALHCRIVIHQDGLLVPVEIEDPDFKALKVIHVSRHNSNHYNLLKRRGNDVEAKGEKKSTSEGKKRKTIKEKADNGKKIKQVEEESIPIPIKEELEEVEMEEYEMDFWSDEEEEETECEMKENDWIVVMKGKGSSSAYKAVEKALGEAPSEKSQRNFVKIMVQNNIQKYADLMNVNNMEEFKQRVDKITLKSTSATSLELLVLSELFNVEIQVHSNDGQKDVLKGITKSSKTVHLYIRDNGSYDLVEKKNRKCKSVGYRKGWYKSFVKGCSYSDEKFENVKQHIEKIHGERAYQCFDCKGKVIRDINAHERRCHSANTICNLCSNQFNNLKGLRKHVAHYHRAHMGMSEPVKAVEDVPLMHLLELMKKLYIGEEQKIFEKNGYVAMFDEKNGRTSFCFTSITAKQQAKKVDRNICIPYWNEPGYTSVTDQCMHFLGYECGHLIPLEDMRFDGSAIEDSFNMLNISPMSERLNNGKWKVLENHIRKIVPLCNRVNYFAVPIYANESTRERTSGGIYLNVPQYFGKIIFYEKPGEEMISQAFLFKNNEEMRHQSVLSSNAVSNEEFLKQTGMEFLNVQQTWSKERVVYVCPKTSCRKNFLSEEQFISHKEEHKNDMFCFVCEKTFIDFKDFNEHLKDHGTYKCHHCGLEFRSQKLLEKHEAVHIDYKLRPYACTYAGCSTRCLTLSHLKAHMLVHSKEPRCFLCDYDGCVKVFLTKGNLNRHKLTHEAPKLECKNCKFKTRRMCELKKHYIKQHGILEMDVENSKYFPGKKKRIWKYECDNCGLKFLKKCDWISHLKRHSK